MSPCCAPCPHGHAKCCSCVGAHATHWCFECDCVYTDDWNTESGMHLHNGLWVSA